MPLFWVLLSTHNICFEWEIRKIIFFYTLLSGGLVTYKWVFVKNSEGPDEMLQKVAFHQDLQCLRRQS